MAAYGGTTQGGGMTMNPAEISRKVRQLDNDVDAIYSMLADMQGTLKRHGNRFDQIEAKVDGLDAKLDLVLERLS
jgi:peptidoglycan hydrolase CwlO-like protein